jgi:mono/diheme cytochrome c family protein
LHGRFCRSQLNRDLCADRTRNFSIFAAIVNPKLQKRMYDRPLPAGLALALLLTAFACDKPGNTPSGPDCQLAGAGNFTYTQHLKPVFDRYCTGCHDGAAGIGPGDFTTYEGLKPRLDDGEVLEFVVIDKTMPQTGSMPQAARDSVNCWIRNGYPK